MEDLRTWLAEGLVYAATDSQRLAVLKISLERAHHIRAKETNKLDNARLCRAITAAMEELLEGREEYRLYNALWVRLLW